MANQHQPQGRLVVERVECLHYLDTRQCKNHFNPFSNQRAGQRLGACHLCHVGTPVAEYLGVERPAHHILESMPVNHGCQIMPPVGT